jgi:general secretion pathway protein H
MPISAIGNERLTGRAFGRDSGVTLVEAMVTLFIVGLLVGAVMLVAPQQDRETRSAAEALARRLALAGEESILTNRPVALQVTAQGYGFARLEKEGWRRIESGSPLTFQVWPQGVDHAVQAETPGAEEGAPVVRFDALGGATPARIVLKRGGVQWAVAVDGQGQAHVARVD